MTLQRATLIVLPRSAVLVLFASFGGVDASSCLPSASAVRHEHPAAWPSWTLRARGHEGVKCWYAATRATAHSHGYETGHQQNPIEAPKFVSAIVGGGASHSSSAEIVETNGIGWSLQRRAVHYGVVPLPEESSFAERFAAVFDESVFSLASLMRRMAEQIGTVL
jgi:hypothetical protein